MTRRMFFPFFLGVLGAAVLVSLGLWQLQRLALKEAVIARIEERLEADPVPLPEVINPAVDKYLRVRVSGVMGPEELHVLTSIQRIGPGFRVIAPLVVADGRRVLIDRGFIPETQKKIPRKTGPVEITGSLHWPRETDKYTPEPNLERNIWFARNVATMATALDTEPVMIVVAETSLAGGPRPQAVTVNIPNSHLGYAVQWFLMAVAWIGMTVYLLWRIKLQTI